LEHILWKRGSGSRSQQVAEQLIGFDFKDAMSQSATLSALGSDLTFSVSFAIARELRDQAVETDISQVELIAVMTLLTIALDRAPEALQAIVSGARHLRVRCFGASPIKRRSNQRASAQKVIDFFRLFVDISRRISASLLVQLVANAISTHEPLRASRIVSLLTITIFFVFLQSGAMVIQPPPRI